MKTAILAVSLLTLTAVVPSDAEAQRRAPVVSWSPVRGIGVDYYRRGYRPGVGVAAGIGAGALAVGAAAAGASYYGSDPCLRQQQYWTGYGYQMQWVRVC
jgi:hypothetical protein